MNGRVPERFPSTVVTFICVCTKPDGVVLCAKAWLFRLSRQIHANDECVEANSVRCDHLYVSTLRLLLVRSKFKVTIPAVCR